MAGTDALGFIVGTAVALRLGVGFVPLRKGGKLPVRKETAEFRDYSGAEKALELRAEPWPRGTRVLLVDEWIETGAQARAAVELIERAGGGSFVLVTDLGMPASGGASFHGGFEVVKRLWKMKLRPPTLMMKIEAKK